MPFKGLVQDLRDGLGSLSRRHGGSFDLRPLPPAPDCLRRSRSLGAIYGVQQSGWAAMPPELLQEVVRRLEQGQSSWPSRRSLVACASVCRHWRSTTLDVLHLNQSGFLTFPFSLKQPGPQDNSVMQCFIKRDRSTSTFRLYLGLTPTLSENGKFLLSARRYRRTTRTEYIISLDADDTSRASTSYIGKLRSNFLGTKFTIYDSDAPYGGVTMLPSSSSSRVGGGGGGRRIGSKRVSPRVPSAGSYNVGTIQYELNVLGTRGPRRMQCTLDATTRVAEGSGGGIGGVEECLDRSGLLPLSKEVEASLAASGKPGNVPVPAVVVLKNKAPRWHEQLQCWCLNFRGRVTVASVKNFQLVNALDPPITLARSDPNYPNEYDQVLLQFGKIGKDTFTMDYRHPLSAFLAFAISLTSFDTKLACE